MVNSPPPGRCATPSSAEDHVTWNGHSFAARPIAAGAAYELFSDTPAPGFAPASGSHGWHRFVHARHLDGALVCAAPDTPLSVPLSHGVDEATVQRLSQTRGEPTALVRTVRDSATIRPGTRMVKPLSPRQAVRLLRSPPWVSGVCFREHDIAQLRTPAERRVLDGDPHDSIDVAFAVRWRACDPGDYEVLSSARFAGMISLPGSDMRGAPILGSGFLPSDRHLIPEFVTAGWADVPLSDRAELLAYTPDGGEVVSFQYTAERAAWTRMAGPRWSESLNSLPGIESGQQAFPVPDTNHTALFGFHQGVRHRASADPPREFRARAAAGAARYAVHDVVRVWATVNWRGIDCVLADLDAGRMKLRLAAPEESAIRATDAQCVERGVYETWTEAAGVGEPFWRQRPYITSMD